MDLPLHVQVAQALGWTYCGPGEWDWEGEPPEGSPLRAIVRRIDQHVGIPHYDTDWAATGPLIQRFNVALVPLRYSGPTAYKWRAVADGDRYSILDAVESRVYADDGPDHPEGPETYGSPLKAVCYLILALHKTGKLPQNV